MRLLTQKNSRKSELLTPHVNTFLLVLMFRVVGRHEEPEAAEEPPEPRPSGCGLPSVGLRPGRLRLAPGHLTVLHPRV